MIMGCKAAVQALQEADVLKAKVSGKCDLLNDSQAWADQQQLQMIYHQVLIMDLEYALDKKVEQELWSLGFKNHITALQELARDKKNSRRSELQALLSWCLEAASGFYLSLLQELCSTFDLDLPFRKNGIHSGQPKSLTSNEGFSPPQKSSCIYMCQYCLVHLGDIARYRIQRKQAESFYKHAILLSPTSGQPYNQLALLEASQGNKLASVFYYVRGIAVKHPFNATATNLSSTFSAAIDKESAISEIQTKMAVTEFIKMFVKVHALLHSATDLEQAELCVKSLNATLTPLVATQSFTAHQLLQIIVINFYALHHVTGSGALIATDLTADEAKVRTLILDLIAESLSAFLLPVYTLGADQVLLDYYGLPAIKLIVCWIEKQPDILQESVFSSRLQIWPSLCKLLNSLQVSLTDFNYTRYEKTPLSEDKELCGFLPLSKAFGDIDFSVDNVQVSTANEKLVRAKRLTKFGSWLSTYDVNSTKLILYREDEETKTMIFEPGSIQPDPTTKLLEDMKFFSVSNTLKPVDSNKPKSKEKRGGILKPQGSLEKARVEREQNLTTTNVSANSETSSNKTLSAGGLLRTDLNKMKRLSQNVALQSIFKKLEENKQVKFDVTSVVDKTIKFEDNPVSAKAQHPPHLNQPFRGPYSQDLKNSQDQHSAFVKGSFPGFSAPFDRNQPFPKNDLHNYPPAGYNSQSNLQMHNFQKNFQRPQNSFGMPQMNQHMAIPFQNSNQFPPPPSCDYSQWKSEERPPVAPWWPNPPNQIPYNNPYQHQPDFRYNSFGCATEYNKTPTTPAPNALNSPWNNMQNSIVGNQAFDGTHQGLSLRQAMLKETQNVISSPASHMNTNMAPESSMQMPPNTPGYSLFNPSSWAPSLPGQFRSNDSPSEGLINNLRQQSLFSRQAPLQQLLEQQNQMKKGGS